MAHPPTPLTMYFDGACPLCSREAAFYTARAPKGSVAFVDIAAPTFDAGAHGLDARAVHRSIHARKPAGDVVVGIDALAQMWLLVPRTRFLAHLTRVFGVRQLMQVGYAIFARFRPYLPGRTTCARPASMSQP